VFRLLYHLLHINHKTGSGEGGINQRKTNRTEKGTGRKGTELVPEVNLFGKLQVGPGSVDLDMKKATANSLLPTVGEWCRLRWTLRGGQGGGKGSEKRDRNDPGEASIFRRDFYLERATLARRLVTGRRTSRNGILHTYFSDPGDWHSRHSGRGRWKNPWDLAAERLTLFQGEKKKVKRKK